MSTFFQYFTELSPEDAFQSFGREHLLAMIAIFLILFFSLRILKRRKKKTVSIVIKIAAVLVPIVEFTHTYWLYLCGETELIRLLPLHLCAMQSFFIPLAVFTNKSCFKEFLFCTSILGGIFAIVFPVGVAGSYPIFHYQSIQTLVLHSLLIFVPTAMIYCQGFVPRIENFSKVLLIFLTVASGTAVIDFLYDQNYMFLNYPPEGTPLELIYHTFGRSAYLGVTLLILGSVCIGMYLLFAENRKSIAREGLWGALKNKI